MRLIMSLSCLESSQICRPINLPRNIVHHQDWLKNREIKFFSSIPRSPQEGKFSKIEPIMRQKDVLIVSTE